MVAMHNNLLGSQTNNVMNTLTLEKGVRVMTICITRLMEIMVNKKFQWLQLLESKFICILIPMAMKVYHIHQSHSGTVFLLNAVTLRCRQMVLITHQQRSPSHYLDESSRFKTEYIKLTS